MDPHALAEERSLALHAEIAARLPNEPALLESARSRVSAWTRGAGPVHRHHAAAWAAVLEQPVDDVAAFLVERSERARELRHVTPFAGAVDARRRWAIWRRVVSNQE